MTKESIGVSIPLIWNNSKSTYYFLGSPKYPTGTALSYGISCSYSRLVYKNFFIIAGIGYFKQEFAIQRPLNYAPNGVQVLYSSKSYLYNTITPMLAVGYLQKVRKYIIKEWISYNNYFSFNQKYHINESLNPSQNKKFSIGNQLVANIGIERTLNNKFSIGTSLMLPVYTNWNKDSFFINSFYSGNEQKIANNIFSIGLSINCFYHF